MSLTATARRIDDGLAHEIDVNGRHTITTDEPEGLGGTDTGPAPHELLPATLASCISTMVALYAQRKGWPLPDLSVDVIYDTDVEPRHFDVTVHLPDGLSDDQVARLRRVADTCPVRRALEAGFAFDERIDCDAVPAPVGLTRVAR
jgi:putative redox protein